MTPSPIALVFGAGPNIGAAVARTFASHGYRIALAARSLKASDSTSSQLNIPADFTRPQDVVAAFDKVKEVFEGVPEVVIYNAGAATFSPPSDPFAVPFASFALDTNVNLHSAYVAAQQAVSGFSTLPSGASRTFIYTGNVLNVTILPQFLESGVGKAGAAHLVWAASDAYREKGYKFYYADERKPDGSPKFRVDGAAHAELYWELSRGETQGPWMQTFVKGEGYRDFEGK